MFPPGVDQKSLLEAVVRNMKTEQAGSSIMLQEPPVTPGTPSEPNMKVKLRT